jgi:hypothetical protein
MATATEKANGLAGGLSVDKIHELMGKGRLRGVYNTKLDEFVASDEPAVDVMDAWPIEFGNKQATTLYQGFRGVVDKAGLNDTILVKQTDGRVYLWHNERIAVKLAELQAEAAK